MTIIRKIPGFIIKFEDDFAEVCFVVNKLMYRYFMPKRKLWRAGVRHENQPFELTEIKNGPRAKKPLRYTIRPLAKKEDCKLVKLPLSKESKRKLAAIIKHFGK